MVGVGAVQSSTVNISGLENSQAVDYVIGTPASLPFDLTGNFSDDSILYVWDEVQNLTLTEDLYVNRVADTNADFIGFDGSNYYIKSGTIVSSHYVQWDPPNARRVRASLTFSSDIYAFITSDKYLSGSDALIGLPGVNYGDFRARGLERNQDTTIFDGPSVEIDWLASSPGDWTRLITASSPVPIPSAMWLLGSGIVGLISLRIRTKR
jgi:hypothetical protein